MADSISKEAFAALVARYPALVAAKDGLAALDAFRYDEAPQLYAAQGRLEPSQLQRLVEWKLRHGKFRPSLMKLVSSNAPETVWSTTSAAAAASTCKSSGGASSDSARSSSSSSSNKDTLGVLTQLRGVGPATASLLLSVLDPRGAIFFSDEAYWWLCCGGRRDAIRYTPKEYDALCARARALGDSLRGVAMVDVEKAAYVAMREEGLGAAGAEAAGEEEGGEKAKAAAKGGDDKATKKKKKRRAREELGSPQGQQGKTSLEKADAEGKAASGAADVGGEVKQQLDDGGLRRSKRTRAR